MTEKTLKLYYVPFSYKVPFFNILTQKKQQQQIKNVITVEVILQINIITN